MTTQEFIKKMAENEALAKKMSECKSPEEAYETAKGAGLTDDIETFKAVMTAVNQKIKGELSDNDLDNVAGGESSIWLGIGVSVGVAVAGLATAGA